MAHFELSLKITSPRIPVGFVFNPSPRADQVSASSDYQYIPQEKVEEFGVHANAYYPLEVSVFKSSTDDALLGLLWNKYWANTLSSSPLISVRFVNGRRPLRSFVITESSIRCFSAC